MLHNSNLILRRTLIRFRIERWCARQDSNLHCAPSEGAASCRWATGAWYLISASTRVFDALSKSAFTRVFDALWGVDRTHRLPQAAARLTELRRHFVVSKKIWSPHHGIEPGTSCLQGRRSCQLSYAGVPAAWLEHAASALRARRSARFQAEWEPVNHPESAPLNASERARTQDRYPLLLTRSRLSQAGEKKQNGQRRRSEIEATLQQGLQLRAERSAAGQFWTFTMSNSQVRK